MAQNKSRLKPYSGKFRFNGLQEKFRSPELQLALAQRSRIFLYFFWERKWFFVAILLGALMLHAPLPEGLSQSGLVVLTMSVVATLLFVTEPIPLPAVALLIVVGEVLLLGLNSSVVAKSLMNDSVLFIMGSLMLAVAVVKQKLDKRIAWVIVRITGTRTSRVCFGISAVSGILASFVGEHTVAAMMLPVGVTLITLTSGDPKKVRNLSAVILFSIAYGCSVASIATPSGGARNAIMIGYWNEFFFDPTNPETYKYLIDYLSWMVYAYPMFLVQLPFVTLILLYTFRPEVRDLSRAVAKLRAQVEQEGRMNQSDWTAILIFLAVVACWILLSDNIGMGTVAIMGAAAFLVAGLVRWEDINSGVNWGVILLYASAISLGIQMKDTGAARWLAEGFLDLLAPLGATEGVGLWAAVSTLTALVTNTMSNGAAVAVLGPIVLKVAVVAEESPIVLGFITSISSAFAYLTIIGTPACTIIYASGYLKARDFLTAGWKMVILSIIIMLITASLYWPIIGI